MSGAELLERAAKVIDPQAFADRPHQLIDVKRRDEARQAAARAFLVFEANRLGVLGDAIRTA